MPATASHLLRPQSEGILTMKIRYKRGKELEIADRIWKWGNSVLTIRRFEKQTRYDHMGPARVAHFEEYEKGKNLPMTVFDNGLYEIVEE